MIAAVGVDASQPHVVPVRAHVRLPGGQAPGRLELVLAEAPALARGGQVELAQVLAHHARGAEPRQQAGDGVLGHAGSTPASSPSRCAGSRWG